MRNVERGRTPWGWAAAAALAVVIVGCQEAPVGPRPQAEIVDGAHNSGNEHFYFLPPMVKAPSYSGTFDPTAAPEVHVCEWSGTACGAEIAVFTTTTGDGSEIVRMEPGDEQYIVNWHTAASNLDPAKTYRIRVTVGSRELGHADVDVVTTGKELKNVNTNEYIALLDDRTLPIKFRIEDGAIPAEERGVVAAGYYHTCALAVGGAAYCWGYNGYGQLGNGSPSGYSAVPVPVSGGHVFTALATGANHSCGLDEAGAAWCWGYGGAGNLGNGTTTYNQLTPVPVSGGHVFVEIVAGAHQNCGRTATGEAWCWGYNYYGQVGVGTGFNYYTTPQLVYGGYAFQSLGAGEYHTCGVTTEGAALCWGYNGNGEVGNGTVAASPYGVLTPTAVTGGHAFASIDVGGYHTCALEPTGAAWCWGYNYFGSVGNGATTTTYPYGVLAPAQVAGGLQFASLTAGEYHACGLDGAGAAWCWGYNAYGQLGDGTTLSSSQPVSVSGGNTFAMLDAGLYQTCGITVLGAAKCWGHNGYGQLGTGGFTQSLTPVGVTGGLTFETP
jgi:alpha-tubulin suppressor-like RCC1 family protein